MDIPMCILRLIFYSYNRQESCALRGTVRSTYFTMANGVKQGGVISAILFSLYVD